MKILQVVTLSEGREGMNMLTETHQPSLDPPLDRHPALTAPGLASLQALAARYV
jgi:hypothetical protein